MLDLKLKVGQKATVNVLPQTATGKAATIDGSVNVTIDNETVCTIGGTNADNTKFEIVGVTRGSAQVRIAADADLDAGETRELTEFINVTVEPVEADKLAVSVSDPVDAE